MMWRTHALFGVSTLWLLAPLTPEILQANMGVLAAAATLGALMPDLDASESKIKHLKIPNTQIKPFMLPALVVSRTDQHRGLLHSLLGLGMMTLFVLPLSFYIGWTITLAFLLGYMSHLVADAATKTGVRLLYPKSQRFHLLPLGWRFTTGSLAEEALLAPLIVSVMSLLLTNCHFFEILQSFPPKRDIYSVRFIDQILPASTDFKIWFLNSKTPQFSETTLSIYDLGHISPGCKIGPDGGAIQTGEMLNNFFN